MSIYDGKQYHTDQVHYLRQTVTFSDGTVSLGWLPKGAVVIDAAAVVTTAFNSGTNNNLNIGFRNAGDGTADDTDEFMSAVAVGSAGKKDADELATAADLHFPEGAELVAVTALTGTAATAGSAEVFVAYLVDNKE